MRQPLHLGSMLSRVASAIRVPLTLKIRSGWDEKSVNASEIARIAEESGVQMLAVHGRTRKDLYRGEADWNIVAQVAQERTIPVVGSGDITNGESAAKALQHGVAGVMIGRGAMENPWIFSEISSYLSGREYRPKKHSETVRVLLRYMSLLREEVPPTVMLGRMKQLISQSTRGLPEGTTLRRTLCSQKDSTVLEHLLQDWHQSLIREESSGEGALSLEVPNSIHVEDIPIKEGSKVHFTQPSLLPHLNEKNEHAPARTEGTL